MSGVTKFIKTKGNYKDKSLEIFKKGLHSLIYKIV